ncbi:MAG: hypothetical protein AB7I27_03770 [Bacteriovoracaceae bacterium]
MLIIDEQKFIEKSLIERGFEIFDYFDIKNTLTLKEFCNLPLERRGDVILVNTRTVLSHPELIENFKMSMNTFLGAIFFHEQKDLEGQKWVQDQAAFLQKIIGEYALPMPDLNWTMLSNQLHFYWGLLQEQKNLQKHMMAFSQQLDQVLESAESQMNKAKKIHDALIPKRTEEIKGVQFLNKYATGDGGGGEFFDFHQSANKVYQIIVSSESYLVTSAVMGLLIKSKQDDFNPDKFYADARFEMNQILKSKGKEAFADLLLLELDLTHLTLKSWGESKSELYSQTRGMFSIGKEKVSLKRGEKIIVFSPGFIFNWKETHKKKNLESFLKNQHQMNSQDLLVELFYQIKLDQESDFLKKDATVVMMEVNRHGIHQV